MNHFTIANHFIFRFCLFVQKTALERDLQIVDYIWILMEMEFLLWIIPPSKLIVSPFLGRLRIGIHIRLLASSTLQSRWENPENQCIIHTQLWMSRALFDCQAWNLNVHQLGFQWIELVAPWFAFRVQVAAVTVYLVCGLFSASYVINFVITTSLLATDFWIVKNVSGRLMVGLRWWNEVNEVGASTWKFESLDQQVSHLVSSISLTRQPILE